MATQDRRAVVYLTSGIYGYLYRFFPIGRRLQAAGRPVTVVSASADAVARARLEGFAAVHLGGQRAALDALAPSTWPRPLDRVMARVPGLSLGPRGPARRHWQARAAILADGTELAAVLAELDPALVLTEAEEHRDIRMVLALGRPLVLFEDLYSARPDPDVPFPARSHTQPTGTRRSRLRAAARWQRFFAVEALRRRAERWWVDGADWHSTLAQLAARAGLDDGALSRRYLQFYDYPGLDRVRTVAPELAFPGERQRPRVTGPVVDLDRRRDDADPDFAERWAAIEQRRRHGGRVVYVSLGTFLSGLRELTALVIDAVAGLAGVDVVVSVGRDHPHWAEVALPPNVALFARVPQLEVLASADLVVSTGGLNTGHEALWFGVPVLNLPVAGVDTPGNAARLAFHGVGRTLRPSQISQDAVRREVAALLDDPAFRERAGQVGQRLRAHDGVTAAVAVIEAHLARTAGPRH